MLSPGPPHGSGDQSPLLTMLQDEDKQQFILRSTPLPMQNIRVDAIAPFFAALLGSAEEPAA